MPEGNDTNWGKFAGIGLQVAIGVALGLWIGSYLDRRFGWTPRGALIGMMIGLSGGLYLLIKEGIQSNKD